MPQVTRSNSLGVETGCKSWVNDVDGDFPQGLPAGKPVEPGFVHEQLPIRIPY